MPIAALGLFGAAQAVLFRLYLPHRYTYALLPFFCIAIGVAVRPTFETLARRTALSPGAERVATLELQARAHAGLGQLDEARATAA